MVKSPNIPNGNTVSVTFLGTNASSIGDETLVKNIIFVNGIAYVDWIFVSDATTEGDQNIWAAVILNTIVVATAGLILKDTSVLYEPTYSVG